LRRERILVGSASPTDPQIEERAVVQEVVATRSAARDTERGQHQPDASSLRNYIETAGKTEISQITLQLPQLFNSALALPSDARVAPAEPRGLGPNRMLLLADGRALGQRGPFTAILLLPPDWHQVRARLVGSPDYQHLNYRAVVNAKGALSPRGATTSPGSTAAPSSSSRLTQPLQMRPLSERARVLLMRSPLSRVRRGSSRQQKPPSHNST
jgi:hypothetical protein